MLSLLPCAPTTKMPSMTDQTLLSQASDQEIEAFVQVVVLVAYADGTLSQSEENVLMQRVGALAGDRVSTGHLEQLMVELPPLSRSTSNWRGERFKRLKGDLKDQKMRQEAFALAVDVASSEGGIGMREGRMLVNMLYELDIDSSFAQKVISEARQANA